MNLLVLGGSRGTGRLAVEEASRQGHRVTALVRRRPPDVEPGGVTWLTGDALDGDAVSAAVAGQEAVLSTLGPGAGSPPDLCARATRLLVDAMRRHGVRRIVMVTGALVGHPADRLGLVYRMMLAWNPPALRAVLEDRRLAERILRESGLDWTLVRPPRLTDGPARGRCRYGEELRLSSFSSIPRAELARFAVEVLGQAAWSGRAVAVAG